MPTGLVVAILLSPLPGEAQAPPTFPVSSERVRLDVLARDGERPLRGLSAGDFEVRDNGVLQRIEVTAAAETPLDLVLVFDASSSVRGAKLEALRDCGRVVAEALGAADRTALVSFSHVVDLRSPMGADRGRLLEALDALQAGGGTALFDAVLAGLVLSSSSSARPVLLLLSDGRDTASWLSEPELIAAARLSETPVYAVSTWPIGALAVPTGGRQTWASVASQSDDAFLRRLARETGGRVFRANSVSSLRKQLAAVLEEIGQRYLIGYTPQGTDAGEWHKVDVRLRRKRATILARPGYSRPARAGGGS